MADKPMHRGALLGWLLGLPLALFAVGCWQWWRADAADPFAHALGMTAAGLSLMALLVAGSGLIYLHQLGRVAMVSRDALLQAFERGRSVFPVYLQVLVVLLYAAAAVSLVYELVWLIRAPIRAPLVLIWMAVAAMTLVCAGFFSLRDARRAARMPQEIEPLREIAQAVPPTPDSALWQFVRAIALQVGTQPPDHVLVGLDGGFFVTERPVQLLGTEQVLQGRTLHLSLPYLAYFHEAELQAVIAHELGHFVGQDLVYSQRFAPIYQTAWAHLMSLSTATPQAWWWVIWLRTPVLRFGDFFLSTFDGAVLHWSRVRELAADAVSVQASSREAAANALLRTAALEARVNEMLANLCERLPPASDDVLTQLSQCVQDHGLDDPREGLTHGQTHPTDTHPDLATRLAALDVTLSTELVERAMEPRRSDLLERFALPPDLSNTLRDRLQVLVQEERAKDRQMLQGMVDTGRASSMAVYEQTTFMVWVLGIVSVIMLGFLILAAIRSAGAVALLVLTALTLPWAIWAYVAWRDGREPAVVIDAQGLKLYGHQLRWADVAGMGMDAQSSNLRLTVQLADGVALPKLGVRRGRAKRIKKHHLLVLTLKGVRGRYLNQVNEALRAAWNGQQASKALKDLDPQGADAVAD